LVGKLKETKIGGCNNGIINRNEDQASNIDSSNDSCTKSFDEEGMEHFNKTFQAGIFFISLFLLTSCYYVAYSNKGSRYKFSLNLLSDKMTIYLNVHCSIMENWI